jgi:hypothetical protein
MVVTQRFVGESTDQIRVNAPKTWRYLNGHAAAFEARTSKIYQNKPAFSIFGVGPYTFAPWKIAISGFYKHLNFHRIGPVRGKPVVFDDTVYFLPCWSEAEARLVFELLTSNAAMSFYGSQIFWPDKRPITAEILRRLNIGALAEHVGVGERYKRIIDAGAENYPETSRRRSFVSLSDRLL